jgi:hypothetical protein
MRSSPEEKDQRVANVEEFLADTATRSRKRLSR